MRNLVRVIGFLVLLLVLMGGAVKGYFAWDDTYNRSLSGSIMVRDPSMVYEGGYPDQGSGEGGVRDGCHVAGFAIGAPVTITDATGETLATGRIVSTFHWDDDDATYIASRRANGCAFRYEVGGVPRRDAYSVAIGGTVFLANINQNFLHGSGEGDYYIIRSIDIGW